MRFVKLTIITFLFFFGIFTAISLMIPAHVRISKAINLKGSSDTVLSLIQDTTEWLQWYPAFMSQRPPGLHIQSIRKNDSEVIVQLQQEQRQPIINGWQIHRFPTSDSLVLQWYMDFHLKWYPWQKFSSLFYEDTYGIMMQQGLSNIKKITDH